MEWIWNKTNCNETNTRIFVIPFWQEQRTSGKFISHKHFLWRVCRTFKILKESFCISIGGNVFDVFFFYSFILLFSVHFFVVSIALRCICVQVNMNRMLLLHDTINKWPNVLNYLSRMTLSCLLHSIAARFVCNQCCK